MDLEGFAAALDRAADELEDGALRIAEEFEPDLLEAFKGYTPVLTGALRDSETGRASGGGGSATAEVSTHLPLYASFRDEGGTIRVKRAKVLTDGTSFFGKEVTQAGAHYKERTIAWAKGALPAKCREVIRDILADAGL